MFTVGNIPKSGHEKFHDFLVSFSISNKALKLQKNRKTETRRRERERKKGYLPGLTSCAAHLDGPAGWPSPPGACLSSFACQRTKQLAGARRRRPGQLLLPLRRPGSSERAMETPSTPCVSPLSLWTPSPSSALSLARSRAELIAAVHRSRSHSLPFASLTRARAPPRLPRPLRQATRRRTPWSTVTDAIFLLCTDGRRRLIRRPQSVPGLALALVGLAVSH